MSETNETLVVCPSDDPDLIETFGVAFAILSILGSIIAYFVQQHQERKDALEAKIKENTELDRNQALKRAREQLRVLVGPLQRLWKTQTIVLVNYRKRTGMGFKSHQEAMMKKGQAYWMSNFEDEFLELFIEDPQSFEAVQYRNFVSRCYKPLYTRIRELVMTHMSDLADMPTQEEWLQIYTEEDITSPHTGSMNINVIYDTYSAYTMEFDDIIESWAEGDFRRMQPVTTVPLMICNRLVDFLYENAKDKAAKYDKHVTVHKNSKQMSVEETMKKQLQQVTKRNSLPVMYT